MTRTNFVVWLNDKIGFDIRYYFYNGSWSVVSEVVQAVCGLAAAAIFARLATQETFGQFQLVMSAIALTAVVSVKGLDNVIMRDSSLNLDGVYRRAIRLRFWWSLLAVPVLLALGGYNWQQGAANISWAYMLAATLAPIHYTAGSWLSFVKGKRQFKRHAIYIAVKSLANLAAVALAIAGTDGNLIAVFAAHFITHIVADGIFSWRTKREVGNDYISQDWKEYAYLLSKAGLVKNIIASMDKILLGMIVSPTALAVYAVAIIIPNYIQLAVKAIFQTASPRLSRRNSISFREVYIVLAIGVVITAGTALLIRLFTEPIFGEEYRPAMRLGYIAVLSLIFHPLAQYLVNYMYMSNNRRAVVVSSSWCPMIKIILLLTVGLYGKTTGFAAVYAAMGLVWVIVPLSAMRIDRASQRILS